MMASVAEAVAAGEVCFPEPAPGPGSRIGTLVTPVEPPFGLSSPDGLVTLVVFDVLGEVTPSGPLRCSMKPITIAASRTTAANPIQIVFEDVARELSRFAADWAAAAGA